MAADNALLLQLRPLIRPGDTFWWGQATAEPLTLTRAFTLHRHALAQGGRLRAFVGIGASHTLRPEHAESLISSGMRPAARTRTWHRLACWTSCPATTRICRA